MFDGYREDWNKQTGQYLPLKSKKEVFNSIANHSPIRNSRQSPKIDRATSILQVHYERKLMKQEIARAKDFYKLKAKVLKDKNKYLTNELSLAKQELKEERKIKENTIKELNEKQIESKSKGNDPYTSLFNYMMMKNMENSSLPNLGFNRSKTLGRNDRSSDKIYKHKRNPSLDKLSISPNTPSRPSVGFSKVVDKLDLYSKAAISQQRDRTSVMSFKVTKTSQNLKAAPIKKPLALTVKRQPAHETILSESSIESSGKSRSESTCKFEAEASNTLRSKTESHTSESVHDRTIDPHDANQVEISNQITAPSQLMKKRTSISIIRGPTSRKMSRKTSEESIEEIRVKRKPTQKVTISKTLANQPTKLPTDSERNNEKHRCKLTPFVNCVIYYRVLGKAALQKPKSKVRLDFEQARSIMSQALAVSLMPVLSRLVHDSPVALTVSSVASSESTRAIVEKTMADITARLADFFRLEDSAASHVPIDVLSYLATYFAKSSTLQSGVHYDFELSRLDFDDRGRLSDINPQACMFAASCFCVLKCLVQEILFNSEFWFKSRISEVGKANLQFIGCMIFYLFKNVQIIDLPVFGKSTNSVKPRQDKCKANKFDDQVDIDPKTLKELREESSQNPQVDMIDNIFEEAYFYHMADLMGDQIELGEVFNDMLCHFYGQVYRHGLQIRLSKKIKKLLELQSLKKRPFSGNSDIREEILDHHVRLVEYIRLLEENISKERILDMLKPSSDQKSSSKDE